MEYKRNHYVPEWYQHRFIPSDLKDKKFYYLDLKPDTLVSNGHYFKRNQIKRWGPDFCFKQDDLYTTKFDDWESTEIEREFFGAIDSAGKKAIDYFSTFEQPDANGEALNILIPYMSIQKLRTPKGLANLANLIKVNNKNHLLYELQRLQRIFCALWSECIWSIADASEANTKFLLSDHPVTVYNRGCFPASKWCANHNDPNIWFSGTHTMFPLDSNKILILTNLSWVRNPYGNPIKDRPNPVLFRQTMFNFMQIQTKRMLSDIEVNQINYIIKKRAYRYVAAVEKEWLYPEKKLPKESWDKIGLGYLLMPDPRSVAFTGEILAGYENGRVDAFDAHGRRPGNKNYDNKTLSGQEWETFQAFKGEFARLFGPKRRGRSFEFGRLDNEIDDEAYHTYHLRLEQKHKKNRFNK